MYGTSLNNIDVRLGTHVTDCTTLTSDIYKFAKFSQHCGWTYLYSLCTGQVKPVQICSMLHTFYGTQYIHILCVYSVQCKCAETCTRILKSMKVNCNILNQSGISQNAPNLKMHNDLGYLLQENKTDIIRI